MKKNVNHIEEHLTDKNKEFLKEAAIDHYSSQSPLQNEPWPRNKWTPK